MNHYYTDETLIIEFDGDEPLSIQDFNCPTCGHSFRSMRMYKEWSGLICPTCKWIVNYRHTPRMSGVNIWAFNPEFE